MSTSPEEQLERLIVDYICTKGMHMDLPLLQKLLSSSEKVLKILKTQSVESRYTAFHCAATRNHPETLKHLLSSVAPEKRFNLLDIRDTRGQTALHRACIAGNTEPIRQMLDSLPSPELQMEFIQLRDDNNNSGQNRALQCFRAEEALFLQTRIRQLTERIEKKKPLPEEQADQTVTDGIWVLELVSDQQEVEYLKLKMEQDDSLLNNITFSLDQIQERKKQIQELRQNVSSTSGNMTNHATMISNITAEDASALSKHQLSVRLGKIEERHKQRLKDLDVLSRQLDVFEVMKRQALQIEKLQETLTEQNKKLNEFQAFQLNTNDAVTAEVGVLKQTNEKHKAKIAETAGIVKELEYNQLPTVGESSGQPYENDSHTVISSPIAETGQQ